MNTAELERLWATRPVRPDAGRTVGGVCAGVAARYRVDPTLVKVAFVVSTLFGGSGLLLYIAGWIAFPGQHGSDEWTGSRRHGHGKPGKVVLVIVLAIIVVTSFGPNETWSSGGIVGAALMLLGWWLLYRRTPDAPALTSADGAAAVDFQRWVPRAAYHQQAGAGMTAAPAATAPPATAPTATAPIGAEPTVTDQATTPLPPIPDEPVPPAWDPLGAARFAWDLPEPTTPDAPAERDRRSPLTLIVVGLAVIAAAAGSAAHYAGLDWFTPGRILSMALAVVAGGLLVAGLQRRRAGGEHHSGLVPIAIVLGAVVIVTTLINGIGSLPSGGAGDRTYAPPTAADLRPHYSLGAGTMELDLRNIALEKDTTVTVDNGMGEIKILIPETMNVRANCQTNVGEVACPEGLSGGTDGTSGPVLTIDAHTKVGRVEVIR